MKILSWFTKRGSEASKNLEVIRGEQEEIRVGLAKTQRQIAARLEQVLHASEKQLVSMVERIRRWSGQHKDLSELEGEQIVLQRLLDRMELVQADTSALLREWRDWMRALRQGMVTDIERAELLRSELRVRGVIMDEEVRVTPNTSQVVSESITQTDLLSEWDQYIGERLPASAAFWQKRVEEAQAEGVHEEVMHGLVTRMRHAHGQAKAWKRMQAGG